MKRRVTILILIVLQGIAGGIVYGQTLTDYLAECELKYGSDADLVNGEKYFYPYSSFEGDPFFVSGSGSSKLRIKGKEFEEQSLRYDIYNHLLILDYKDVYGVQPAWYCEMNGWNLSLLVPCSLKESWVLKEIRTFSR